jgi:hypothetical protein
VTAGEMPPKWPPKLVHPCSGTTRTTPSGVGAPTPPRGCVPPPPARRRCSRRRRRRVRRRRACEPAARSPPSWPHATAATTTMTTVVVVVVVRALPAPPSRPYAPRPPLYLHRTRKHAQRVAARSKQARLAPRKARTHHTGVVVVVVVVRLILRLWLLLLLIHQLHHRRGCGLEVRRSLRVDVRAVCQHDGVCMRAWAPSGLLLLLLRGLLRRRNHLDGPRRRGLLGRDRLLACSVILLALPCGGGSRGAGSLRVRSTRSLGGGSRG